MSNETNEQTAAKSDVEPAQLPDDVDWLLVSLIETYAADMVHIGVTLTVGGSVVSGTLISGRTYFAEVHDFLKSKSAEEGDLFAEIAADFGSMGPDIYDKPKDAPEDWQPTPPTYIHLKEARFHAPGGSAIPQKTGFLWRGKLASVDAFCVGSFTSGEPSDDE